jgi:predicted RNase H-like nuclease (RuvC/YqgF family)
MGDNSWRPASKKSGQQRGADNVRSVAEYLDQLERTGERIPLNLDGGPNYSEIARHCGFGRQVFYTNEKARTLIEQRIQRFAESCESPKVRSVLHKVDTQNRQIQRLEEKVATLSVEVEALRQQNRELEERLRQYELMEEVMDVGRFRP